MTYESFRQKDQTADSNGNGTQLSRQTWDQAGNFDWGSKGGSDTGSQHVPNMTLFDGSAGGGTTGESAHGQNGNASWQNNESAWQNAASFLSGGTGSNE